MRTLNILQSLAPRESRRLDLALIRVLFLVAVILVWLPFSRSGLNPAMIGFAVHVVFLNLSLLLVVFLALWLAGDGVGDVRSEMLELLFLTGLTPGEWLNVRLAQIWIDFASVWIIRLPLLCLIYRLGGVTFERVVMTELLLLTGFLIFSSVGLLASFTAKSRQQLFGVVLILIFIWELALAVPYLLINQLSLLGHWGISFDISDIAEFIFGVGMASQIHTALFNAISFADFLPTVIVYAALSVLALAQYRRLLAALSRGAIISTEVGQSHEERSNEETFRASRPCWDDALAWQAYCVHGKGKQTVIAKCIFLTLLSIVLLFSFFSDYFNVIFPIIAFIGGIMLLSSTGQVGDCLTRELREKTMPMLLITPLDWDDYYAGWRRGSWHLAWPEAIFAAVISLASLRIHPLGPAIAIAVAGAILCSGPFFMLSPLIPFTFQGISVGAVMIFVMIVLIVICAVLSVAVHPLMLPITLIPVAYCFNLVLRKGMLPYWMRQKVYKSVKEQ